MAQRKKPPRRKPKRKPSRKRPRKPSRKARRPAAEASDTMVTIDKNSVKTVEGFRDALRQLEVLTETGTLDFEHPGYGDYQAPCACPHLVMRRE
jgi:hypothetical protein